MIIVGVYRSPRSQEAEFCHIFEEIVEELSESAKDIVIVGDFNIDWSRESVYKMKIECIINDNGFKQLIKDYTRVTKDSKTVIDYVITNVTNITSDISSTNKISDHELIEIRIKNANNPKMIRNGAKMFKYGSNIFQRETNNNILGNEERQDLNYNVNLPDEALQKTIGKLSANFFRDKIEYVRHINPQDVRDFRFKFRAISNYELRTVCKDIKTKPDYNSVNIKMILDNWNEIGDRLLKIINESMETGIFPENWKTSNYVIIRWKNISRNKKVISNMIFEEPLIDRDILIQKLYNYGLLDNKLN